MRVGASRDPFVNERECLLICLRYIHILRLPSRTPGAGELASTQSSQPRPLLAGRRHCVREQAPQLSCSPGILGTSEWELEGRRRRIDDGFRDISQLVNQTATSEAATSGGDARGRTRSQ